MRHNNYSHVIVTCINSHTNEGRWLARSMSAGPVSPLGEAASSITHNNPRSTSPRDWEEVANALLEDGLVLTALELQTELLEAGREVTSLRDYFSNPGNFESAIPQLPSALLIADMGIIGDNYRHLHEMHELVARCKYDKCLPFLCAIFVEVLQCIL